MDNRIFNVNGKGDEMLLAALRLVFQQRGQCTAVESFVVNAKKGMILLSYGGGSKFPTPLEPEQIQPIVSAWLKSGPLIECIGWDEDAGHDGDNSLGWRVYCENWGHVGEHHGAICAIKPVYLWYGK